MDPLPEPVDGSNNLRDDQYDAFADYLTEVVKHYRDEWGITFRTLNPLNEPSSDWWKKGNMQEGSHFTNEKQAEIIKKVAASLKSKGLDGTVISAADDNSIDETVFNFNLYDQDTLDVIQQINTHSYNGSKMEEPAHAGRTPWQKAVDVRVRNRRQRAAQS